VLGVPAGRTPRPVFAAIAAQAADREVDLSSVTVVLMDEYAVEDPGGSLRACPIDAHFSCRGAVDADLRRAVEHRLPPGHRLRPDAIHAPDPADPAAYEQLLADVGGVDLFVLASGASDGHVAFNPPGTPLDSRTRVVELATTTRQDNLATFPGFGSIDDVPRFGVSVGLGTIAAHTRRAVLVLTGPAKHESYRLVTGATAFDPAWPATVVHACRGAHVVADAAAAGSLTR
jgi:glucosamine-6-phosphate deaminase